MRQSRKKFIAGSALSCRSAFGGFSMRTELRSQYSHDQNSSQQSGGHDTGPTNKDGSGQPVYPTSLNFASENTFMLAQRGASGTELQLHASEHEEDPPLRLPASWHAHPDAQPRYDTRRSWLKHGAAAAMGFALGIMIIVPTVVWLVLNMSPGTLTTNSASLTRNAPPVEFARTSISKDGTATAAAFARASSTGSLASAGTDAGESYKPAVKVLSVRPNNFGGEQQPTFSALTTGSTRADTSRDDASGRWVNTATKRAAPTTSAKASGQTNQVAARALETAQAQLASGRIDNAREALLQAIPTHEPAILFALAETFDPNMLKSWGKSAAKADVMTARLYYRQALVVGVDKAAERLLALKR